MFALGAFQFRFPLGRSDGNQALSAKRIDGFVRIHAVDEDGLRR
jgi:hypothetical protein